MMSWWRVGGRTRRIGLSFGLIVVMGIAAGLFLALSRPQTVHLPPTERVLTERVFTVGELELTIVDRNGLIEGVHAGGEWPVADNDVTAANPPATERELVIAWTATPCETRPRIVLDAAPGEAANLLFDRDVRDSVPCESIGVGRVVILELSVELPAETVRISQ